MDVFKDSIKVGAVTYRHLEGTLPAVNDILNPGDSIGVVSDDYTTGGGCYDFAHSHTEWIGQVSSTQELACGGSNIDTSVAIGVLQS